MLKHSTRSIKQLFGSILAQYLILYHWLSKPPWCTVINRKTEFLSAEAAVTHFIKIKILNPFTLKKNQGNLLLYIILL